MDPTIALISCYTFIRRQLPSLVLYVFVLYFQLNILCCTFLGSYGVVCFLSLCIHGSLHHVAVEPIRRATVEKYYTATFSAPFTAKGNHLTQASLIKV